MKKYWNTKIENFNTFESITEMKYLLLRTNASLSIMFSRTIFPKCVTIRLWVNHFYLRYLYKSSFEKLQAGCSKDQTTHMQDLILVLACLPPELLFFSKDIVKINIFLNAWDDFSRLPLCIPAIYTYKHFKAASYGQRVCSTDSIVAQRDHLEGWSEPHSPWSGSLST